MFSFAGAPALLQRQGWLGTLQFYILRFWTVRCIRRTAIRLRFGSWHRTNQSKHTLFAGHDVDRVVTKIRAESFYSGLQIPEQYVDAIRRYAKEAPVETWINGTKVGFLLPDRKRVEHRHGKPIIIAAHPGASRNCDAVRELMRDPLVMDVSGRYLGYEPRNVTVRLFWSFACEAPTRQRISAKQTLYFHYDASHFLHFNFYLTNVDASGGPHALIRNSHGPKSLAELLFSTERSDEYIERKFGSDRIATLVGPAGFGFVEDQYCYHKATVPLETDRLMLILHMS